MKFDTEYLRLCKNIIANGVYEWNERTKLKCLMYHGDMMKFDLASGQFPILTTKQIYTKQMVAELLGFIRGFDNAKDFRDLGCNFWNANANESQHWLENPNRKGEDDLGRIYGVQARQWRSVTSEGEIILIDQLRNVIDKLSKGIDDRRLIVSHWNPGELSSMSLPPCHMFYQFGIRAGHLDLSMYQRSCDVPLGVPMNIASYALLLVLVAQITNLSPGIFTHFLHNIHVYQNQLEGIVEQLKREPFESPKIWINPEIKSLHDLETWVQPDDIRFLNYQHHPAINFPFAA